MTANERATEVDMSEGVHGGLEVRKLTNVVAVSFVGESAARYIELGAKACPGMKAEQG